MIVVQTRPSRDALVVTNERAGTRIAKAYARPQVVDSGERERRSSVRNGRKRGEKDEEDRRGAVHTTKKRDATEQRQMRRPHARGGFGDSMKSCEKETGDQRRSDDEVPLGLIRSDDDVEHQPPRGESRAERTANTFVDIPSRDSAGPSRPLVAVHGKLCRRPTPYGRLSIEEDLVAKAWLRTVAAAV